MRKMLKLHANWIWPLLCIALAGLTVLAAGRSLIIGMDADEQYAVVLAYRIAQGDLLIQEIWDPHQTSAILPALLIKLFQMFVSDNTCLLLFLRTAGILFQAGVAFLWYLAMRARYGGRPALLTALVLFHTLPKWIVTPEFANQQMLFWILTILCLYRYDETKKSFYCVLAGISLCFTVLAYPSCVLLFFPYVIWLGKRERRAAVLLTLTCFLGAGIFVGYLFSYLSFSEFGLYMEQILGDPSHNAGPLEKLIGYCREVGELAVYLCFYLIVGLFFSWLVYRGINRKRSYGRISYRDCLLVSVLCAATVDQIRLWALGLVPAVHPQIHYLVLFVFGGFLYHGVSWKQASRKDVSRKHVSQEKKARWAGLYELAWLPSLVGFGAVILLTNLDFKASFVHLLPGMLAALLFWCDSGREQRAVSTAEVTVKQSGKYFGYRLILPVMWVFVLIGARGYLVRADEGRPENVFCVKQKALYGAAKNVYCSYMTGYQYNSDYLFIGEKLEPGTKALYIGNNLQLIYLMNDIEVCAASVISTPTFDERYLTYYEMNQDKLPEAIIIDKSYFLAMEEKHIPISGWLRTEYDWEGKEESEFLWVVRQR